MDSRTDDWDAERRKERTNPKNEKSWHVSSVWTIYSSKEDGMSETEKKINGVPFVPGKRSSVTLFSLKLNGNLTTTEPLWERHPWFVEIETVQGSWQFSWIYLLPTNPSSQEWVWWGLKPGWDGSAKQRGEEREKVSFLFFSPISLAIQSSVTLLCFF